MDMEKWVQLDFGGPPKFKSGLNPVSNLAHSLNKELITTICRFHGAYKRHQCIWGLTCEYMMPLSWLWHEKRLYNSSLTGLCVPSGFRPGLKRDYFFYANFSKKRKFKPSLC